MQDNFNLKGFLRNNRLLNEGIGGYVDLKPLKEMNFDEMNEAPGGKASLELDWAAGMPELKAQCKKHGLTCKVVDEFGPGGGNPLVKIMGPKENIIDWLNDGYVNDEEELEMFVSDIQEGDMNEEEDSFIQAQRDAIGAKGSSVYGDDNVDDYDNKDRMMDLGGNEIEKGIMFLLDDGFEPEDVLEMCKMFIDAHSQAAAKGKKF